MDQGTFPSNQDYRSVNNVETAELYTILEEQYFGEHMHEREEIERLPDLLHGVSVFVDVGASLGQYSFHANRILQKAAIYCIEADPIRVIRLKQLAEQWQRSSSNKIAVIHAAAADRNTRTTFYTTDANASGGLFIHNPELHNTVEWKAAEVNCITLDSAFENLEPDLIKIDVEGAEYRVLQGARSILERGKCRFLVEVHPWGDKAERKRPSDVFQLFARYGYDAQRTHHHWLFVKTNKRLRLRIRSALIGFVLNNDWLRTALKRCAHIPHSMRLRSSRASRQV